MSVKEENCEYEYPVISDTIYNIYNETAIIAYFRTMGYSPEKISEMLNDIKLPKIREEIIEADGIKIIRRAMKGQNAYAASTVLEALSETDGSKEVILMLDEIPDETGLETICWIWDTNFELLNDPNIKKIIVRHQIIYALNLIAMNVYFFAALYVIYSHMLHPFIYFELRMNICSYV